MCSLAPSVTRLILAGLPFNLTERDFISLCDLTRLTFLEWDSSGGTQPEGIPAEITALADLQQLRVDFFGAEKDALLGLSWELSKLQVLTMLKLTYPPSDCMDLLMKLPSLQALKVIPSGYKLALPSSLCSMTSLEALSLSYAEIVSDFKVLGDLTQLKRLKLRSITFDGRAVQDAGLCSALSELQQLSCLVLDIANIRHSSFGLSTLSHMSHLTSLNLCVWHLESPVMPAGLTGLHSLDIVARTGLSRVFTAADVAGLTNLTRLRLTSEDDAFQVTESLVSLLGALPSLQELDLLRYNLHPWSEQSKEYADAFRKVFLCKPYGSKSNFFFLENEDPRENVWSWPE